MYNKCNYSIQGKFICKKLNHKKKNKKIENFKKIDYKPANFLINDSCPILHNSITNHKFGKILSPIYAQTNLQALPYGLIDCNNIKNLKNLNYLNDNLHNFYKNLKY